MHKLDLIVFIPNLSYNNLHETQLHIHDKNRYKTFLGSSTEFRASV